jgi:hypothetical protein
MTREDLIHQGYELLCDPYLMPSEDIMFSRAAKQLAKPGGDIHYFLWSEDRDTVEIWTIPSRRQPPNQ